MKYSQIKYIDNKMSQTCGYFEPINSTKSALFKSVMALYSTFSTSFYQPIKETNQFSVDGSNRWSQLYFYFLFLNYFP